jgi:hypothetical protein
MARVFAVFGMPAQGSCPRPILHQLAARQGQGAHAVALHQGQIVGGDNHRGAAAADIQQKLQDIMA